MSAAAGAEGADRRRSGSEHPAAEVLLDYRAGDLPSGEAERLREHLAGCGACARLLLDFEGFPDLEPPREELRLGRERLEGAWKRFAAASATRARHPARRDLLAAGRGPRALGLAYALAAGFFAAALGLALWVGQLRSRLEEAARPRLNVYLADLVPAEARRERGEETAQSLRVPRQAGEILLLLNLREPRFDREYEVAISDAEGRAVWSRRGLFRGPRGMLTLELPRGFLAPGRYRLRLVGLENGRREPVVVYDFDLEYDGD